MGAPVEAQGSCRRRRIAVVGAGPVGLWTALRIARKYRGSAREPEVHVLESLPQEQHQARLDVRLVLSTASQSLLNDSTSLGTFSSGISVADIEGQLLGHLRKVRPRGGCIRFGQHIEHPRSLAERGDYDSVFWTGGRRSLGREVRRELGCEMRVGFSERVLVVQLGKVNAPSADLQQLASTDLAIYLSKAFDQSRGAADSAPPCTSPAGPRSSHAKKAFAPRVMLRPGAGHVAAWLWLFGLPREATTWDEVEAAGGEARLSATAPATFAFGSGFRGCTSLSLPEAVGAVLPCGASDHPLLDASEELQKKLMAEECEARWVEASYWSSDRCVCDLGAGRSLVLLGDAACGKPFYSGSTLNRHIADVAAFIDSVDLEDVSSALDAAKLSLYEQQYQSELKRLPEYHRQRSSTVGHALQQQQQQQHSQQQQQPPQLQPRPSWNSLQKKWADAEAWRRRVAASGVSPKKAGGKEAPLFPRIPSDLKVHDDADVTEPGFELRGTQLCSAKSRATTKLKAAKPADTPLSATPAFSTTVVVSSRKPASGGGRQQRRRREAVDAESLAGHLQRPSRALHVAETLPMPWVLRAGLPRSSSCPTLRAPP